MRITDQTVIDQLSRNGKFNSSIYRSDKFLTMELNNYIQKRTSFLPQNVPFICRLQVIRDKITSMPKCFCGNPVNFTGGKLTKYCSYSCSNKSNDEGRITNRKQNMQANKYYWIYDSGNKVYKYN